MKAILAMTILFLAQQASSAVCDGSTGSFEFQRSVMVGTKITYFNPYLQLGPDLRAVLLDGNPRWGERVTGDGLCRAFGHASGHVGQYQIIRGTRLGAIIDSDGTVMKVRDSFCDNAGCDGAVEILTCDLASVAPSPSPTPVP